MTGKERPQPHPDGFDFSERERLYYRVSDARFRAIFSDEQTDIHKMDLSHNNYGMFMFVTLSRSCIPMTFYGLGYHEYRERWIHDEWFWYQANRHPSTMARKMDKAEAEKMLKQRLEEIAPQIAKSTQSRRGQLFELLADLTDDDGAYSEMADLGPWLDDWKD